VAVMYSRVFCVRHRQGPITHAIYAMGSWPLTSTDASRRCGGAAVIVANVFDCGDILQRPHPCAMSTDARDRTGASVGSQQVTLATVLCSSPVVQMRARGSIRSGSGVCYMSYECSVSERKDCGGQSSQL
jgi:hypothetical protein